MRPNGIETMKAMASIVSFLIVFLLPTLILSNYRAIPALLGEKNFSVPLRGQPG
jgi:hypothetical protein